MLPLASLHAQEIHRAHGPGPRLRGETHPPGPDRVRTGLPGDDGGRLPGASPRPPEMDPRLDAGRRE